MSTERIVVQRSIAEKFHGLLVEASEELYGKNSPTTGLVNVTAVDKNKRLVSDAVSKGADIAFGDLNMTGLSANSMRPMIVQNVTKEMDIYATESFGPTVSLIVVENDDDAVSLANDTEYGLTSAVFTGNLFRGLHVAKQIESG